MHVLVAFLIFLVVLVVATIIVIFILENLAPSTKPWSRNVCLAVAALILLIWLVRHYSEIVGAFHV